MTDQHQPLWPDMRIGNYAINQTNDHVEQMQIYDGMKIVRDEYQAALATLQQENARIAEDKAMLQARVWELDAELAALRAEARYVPVEEGEYGSVRASQKYRVNGNWIGLYESEDYETYKFDASILLDLNHRICRLVPGQACTEQSECDTPAQEGSE